MSELELDDESVHAPPFQNSSKASSQQPVLDETAKLRRWQEERIGRKLRGEYEAYVRKLNELIQDSANSPARITSVRVDGAPNTRASFLASIVSKNLPPPSTGSGLGPDETLTNALHTSRHITAALISTGIFSSVSPTLALSTSPFSSPHDYALRLQVRERGKFFLKSSTDVGSNNDGSASVTARVRNAFGGAETIEGALSFGTQTTRSGHLRCEWPVIVGARGEGNVMADLGVFGLERDASWYASLKEGVKGFRACLRGQSILGAHEAAYEAAIRHNTDLGPNASLSMRQSAGYTTKSSISHTLTRDTRDDPLQGTRGSYLKCFTVKISKEFAGLGGDAAFIKTESDSQYSRALWGGHTISLSMRTGFLYPLFGRSSLFNDRFQLGGPNTIRMFKPNGMGPRDGDDSVGGDMYWAVGASVIGPLPFKPHWPLKAHMFVNAGRLDSYDINKSPIEQTLRSLTTPCISAGVGLVYMFSPVRVELNFGVPIAANVSDGARKGVQVGIGIDFL